MLKIIEKSIPILPISLLDELDIFRVEEFLIKLFKSDWFPFSIISNKS